jgi:hypothetical protein
MTRRQAPQSGAFDPGNSGFEFEAYEKMKAIPLQEPVSAAKNWRLTRIDRLPSTNG